MNEGKKVICHQQRIIIGRVFAYLRSPVISIITPSDLTEFCGGQCVSNGVHQMIAMY